MNWAYAVSPPMVVAVIEPCAFLKIYWVTVVETLVVITKGPILLLRFSRWEGEEINTNIAVSKVRVLSNSFEELDYHLGAGSSEADLEMRIHGQFIKEVIPEEIGKRLREAGQRWEANKGIILAKTLGSIGSSCVPQTNSRVLHVRIVATWGKGAGLSHPFGSEYHGSGKQKYA